MLENRPPRRGARASHSGVRSGVTSVRVIAAADWLSAARARSFD
jgi:hypothetical protein